MTTAAAHEKVAVAAAAAEDAVSHHEKAAAASFDNTAASFDDAAAGPVAAALGNEEAAEKMKTEAVVDSDMPVAGVAVHSHTLYSHMWYGATAKVTAKTVDMLVAEVTAAGARKELVMVGIGEPATNRATPKTNVKTADMVTGRVAVVAAAAPWPMVGIGELQMGRGTGDVIDPVLAAAVKDTHYILEATVSDPPRDLPAEMVSERGTAACSMHIPVGWSPQPVRMTF